jgi:hypothetical protein
MNKPRLGSAMLVGGMLMMRRLRRMAVQAAIFAALIGGSITGLQADDSASSTKPPLGRKPNIIIILADDMGWGDTGYNGNKVQKTPALDRMAGEGIRFDRFYAACTVCSPTRASIMTGQNGARMGISHWGSSHVISSDILISRILKEEGYATGPSGNGIWVCSTRKGRTILLPDPALLRRTSVRLGCMVLTTVSAPKMCPPHGIR